MLALLHLLQILQIGNVQHVKTQQQIFYLYQAGCEDGCVRLFDITSGNIEYARVFSKQDGTFMGIRPSDSYLSMQLLPL